RPPRDRTGGTPPFRSRLRRRAGARAPRPHRSAQRRGERDRYGVAGTRARRCRRGRPPAGGGRRPAAAARPPDRTQGPRRHGRCAHDLRVAVVPRPRPGRRRAARHTPARRRRDHDRQDQHAGVGGGLAHLQPGLRADPQPVGHVPVGGRLERRRGRRARVPDAAACGRQRPGRLAAQPGGVERRRGPAADPGRRPVVAGGRAVAAVLGRRAHGADGRRRRAAARGDGRPRPAGAALPAGGGPRAGAPARRRPARSARGLESVAGRADLGLDVAADEPDLAGADTVFETWRAFGFALSLGELYDSDGDRMKQTVRWNIERGRALTVSDLTTATRLHAELHARALAFFDRYDYLACPVTQVEPFPVEDEYPAEVAGAPMGTYLEWMRSCSRISATGCPAISIPAGLSADDLPVGLQLVARPFAERALLEVAHALDALTGYSRLAPPVAVGER